MWRTTLMFMAVVAYCVSVHAQATSQSAPAAGPTTAPVRSLAQVDRDYADRVSQADRIYREQVAVLRRQRTQQLQTLLDRAMASRNLDEAIRLRDLIKASEDGATAQMGSDRRGIATPVPKPSIRAPIVQRGNPVADSLYWAACDFVINVWHNGELISWKNRKMENEIFGRTIERVSIDLREGDWVVFQVANNIVRSHGDRLFIATALLKDKPVIATSASEAWSFEDDPDKADEFIASHDRGQEQQALLIPMEETWKDGLSHFQSAYPKLDAQPIWGKQPLTWIKLGIPPSMQPKPAGTR